MILTISTVTVAIIAGAIFALLAGQSIFITRMRAVFKEITKAIWRAFR